MAKTDADIARAVDELLLERDRLDAQGFLADSPIVELISSSAETVSLAGKPVGVYKIESLIGRGGIPHSYGAGFAWLVLGRVLQ